MSRFRTPQSFDKVLENLKTLLLLLKFKKNKNTSIFVVKLEVVYPNVRKYKIS